MKHFIKNLILLFVLLTFNHCCSDDNSIPDPITVVWERISSPAGYKGFTDIELLNNDFGVICGSDGTVIKTDNGGLIWTKINVGVSYSFLKVFLLSENEFFVARHGLYKTLNGGMSFTEVGNLSSFGASIFAIHFFDSNTGLIYKSGRVFKTNDGGQNWEVVYEGGFCYKMQFVSDNIGYVAGGASWDGMSYGEFHKTVDGGSTWTNLGTTEEVYNGEIMALYFISEDTGFIANFNREFYITQDGGATWKKQCDLLPHFINDIVFISKDEGYGAAYWGILKTTDGGITWTWDYKNESFVLTSIAKTTDNTIMAVGNDGVILRKGGN